MTHKITRQFVAHGLGIALAPAWVQNIAPPGVMFVPFEPCEQMQNKEMALLVAAGKGRGVSARAAIKGGYVTHLATSTGIARELLAWQ